MSEQQQSTERAPVSAWQQPRVAPALARQPAGFWLAALASVGIIIGGVGPWATTAYTLISISGTSMHGWREVAVGALGLVMLGLHLVRRGRLPLLVAAVAGALGAMGAVASLNKINSDGSLNVLGMHYQYMNPAWGLYLVLAGAIVLALSASALAWRVSRATG
jgi:hypothetical protein